MNRRLLIITFISLLVTASALLIAAPSRNRISLPTSKMLIQPLPGSPQPMNSFPVNIQVSPDQKYAAILEAGYGDVETQVHQSIAILDFATHQVTRFADPRLGPKAHQSCFIGLAWSTDGRHLYAPIGSTSDPEGKKEGDTGNGIAVYSFNEGKIAPERWIPIPPQPLAPGKKRGTIHKEAPEGQLIPWPAGIAVTKGDNGDRLLVADNLSDDVLLMDAATGNITHRYDVNTGDYVPSAYPYAISMYPNAQIAWVSLWNASKVLKLDLNSGDILQTILLRSPKRKSDAGSHPSAMTLGNGALLVALSNNDEVAVIDDSNGKVLKYLSTKVEGQQQPGSYPVAPLRS